MGGLVVIAGSAVFARLALGGGFRGAAPAIGRLLAAVVLKWVVVVAVLALGLAVLRLPPLPLLAGMGAALLAVGMAAIRR